MKILYVSANGYIGGAERFVLNAVVGHKLYGEQQADLLCFFDGELPKQAQSNGVKTYVLKTQVKLSSPIKVLKTIIELRNILKLEDYDIVHSTMPYVQLIVSLATIFNRKIKKIWFQHGPVWGILDFLSIIFRVDRIYFNSKYTEECHLSMPLSSRHKKTHQICRLGIDKVAQTNSESIRDKYLSLGEDFLLISVGRITDWKGQHLILQAMAKLDKAILDKIKVLIIGSAHSEKDKNYHQEIKKLASNNDQLKDKAIFVDHINDIENYYAAADIFLHTSITPEPFGLVVCEAMLHDTLVIGSNKGGINDILIDKKTGLTYSTDQEDSASQLALRIVDALDDNTVIKKHAQDVIKKEYSIKNMIDFLEKDLL